MYHFIIPLYNEERNLPGLLDGLESSEVPHASMVFVNDGSRDRSADIIRGCSSRHRITLLDFKENRGPGAAFLAGFSSVLETGAPGDAVFTMEADNTSDRSIIMRMATGLSEADVVLASCYHPQGAVMQTVWYRWLVSKIGNLLFRLLFGLKGVHTYTSFFRAYRWQALWELREKSGEQFITERGFGCMLELLVRLNSLGLRIAEVPMVLHFDRRLDRSKMHLASNIVRHIALLAKLMRYSSKFVKVCVVCGILLWLAAVNGLFLYHRIAQSRLIHVLSEKLKQ